MPLVPKPPVENPHQQKLEPLVTAQALRSALAALMGRQKPLSVRTVHALTHAPGCPSVVIPGNKQRWYLASLVYAWVLACSTPAGVGAQVAGTEMEGERSLHRRRGRPPKSQPNQAGLGLVS